MRLRFRQIGDVAALEADGSTLDAERSDEFRVELESHLLASRKVLLDLNGIAFADSTGLGAILVCLHRAAATGGKLRICGLRPLVQEMFHVLKLDRLVDVHATQEEALLAFGVPLAAA